MSMNLTNSETILRQGIVVRPFEARVVSDELRARVQHFQNLLHKKRVKNQLILKKFNSRKVNHF